MQNSNGTTTTNPAQGVPNSNGINPGQQQQQQPKKMNQQYTATADMDMPQGYHHHPQQGYSSPSAGGGGGGGWQRQFSPSQGFFDPDIDDMFSDTGLRSHLSHMRDPFGTFGSRKRSGNKNPLHSVSPSYYDDDDADFPQFGSLGRRRAGGGGGGIPTATDGGMQHDDFFERLPPEFRQLIPEGFGIRRGGSGSGMAPESPRVQQQQQPQPQFYQTYVQPGSTPPQGGRVPRSPPVQTRTVCDAAIQTEDPSGRSEVDGHHSGDNLNQHGLRNTVDMGVKAPAESGDNSRSHSAPPQQQEPIYPHEVPIQQQQPVYNSQGTGTQRNTPPPQRQPPQFQKVYYPPPNQPQQQPAAPQTPGGSYVRTIPIFVEGRSEPLINHKDIPQAEAQPTRASAHAQAQAQAHSQTAQQPPQPQANRPTPINTQQQPTAAQQQQQGPPPATPHTMDSINKIQDIQRDVLNLMTEVEKFGGTRQDKEYAYLDEMLTRNLLKLDTIDTQGKESIRLARKEAIKCIQASINVLEAKAEENAKTAQPQEEAVIGGEDAAAASADQQQPIDVSNVHEPIPLPPPEAAAAADNVPADVATVATAATVAKEASPAKETNSEATTTTTVTKSSSGGSSKAEAVAESKSE